MKQEQLAYDVQAMMPIINDMITQEATKTQQMSDQLVKIGETALAMSIIATDVQEQNDKNSNYLSDIIKNQEHVIETLTATTQALKHDSVDAAMVDQLKDDFASKLETVLSLHGADKEAIMARIGEVYGEYTDRVVDLSKAIITLNDALTNPEYHDRVDALSKDLSTVKHTLDELNRAHDETARLQQEKVDGLALQLKDVYDTFNTLIDETNQSRDHVTRVLQYIKLIEDRLDALLEVDKTPLDHTQFGGE